MSAAIDEDHPASPVKVYEYLSCERPAITNNQKELRFIEDIDCGYIVDPVTAQNVATAIRDFYEMDEKSRVESGKRCREYIKEHHTWGKLPELVAEGFGTRWSI
jgi:glycosyltransferase involved in cell wall biosynthesis